MAVEALTATNVAVIGGGFAGLSAAWHLRQCGLRVTLFEKDHIGAGASGIAAGLLHAYMGRDAQKAWMADEALTATRALLTVSAEALKAPVIAHKGMLRVALNERQQASFYERSELHDDVEWLDATSTSERIPGLVSAPGILVHSGLCVDCPKYLQGLWLACEGAGVKRVHEAPDITTLRARFEHVIVTAGASSLDFPELTEVPLRRVKGQLVVLRWPDSIPPIKIPINSHVYILPPDDSGLCVAGATFERDYIDYEPCEASARELLMPKIASLMPALASADIVEVRAGVRVTTPTRLPIVQEIDQGLWVFSGLGARGLLYHGLYGEQLSEQIVKKEKTKTT